MRNLLILLIILLFYSCSSKIDSGFVEKNGEEIKNTFTSVIISKRGKSFIIEDKRVKPSTFIEVIKKGNTYTIKSDIIVDEKQFYVSKIKLLDRLGFNASTSEDSIFGIDIKLYGENENLIYCSDIKEVNEKEWIRYLNSLRKIDDNWYVEENVGSVSD